MTKNSFYEDKILRSKLDNGKKLTRRELSRHMQRSRPPKAPKDNTQAA